MQKNLDEALAEAAIRDLQIRYCRAVDRMDTELLRSCFHPDAALTYGIFQGGVEDFLDVARDSVRGYLSTTHFTGNQLVEVSGDHAWAEHYAIAYHRCPQDEQGPLRDFTTWIRYVDRVERRDGDWRIATRHLILDSHRTDPVPEAAPGPPVDAGRRDRSDASYALRGDAIGR